MLFNSLQFLVFFALVFAVYWSLPWQRLRVYLLLGASFYFYASWNPWLALLIVASTTVDFFLARGIENAESPRLRKLLLTINIFLNLGLLCYFKYANFFLDSLKSSLHAAGLSISTPVLDVILPIGISFYTFEAINYMVDVYRRHVRAESNLAHFMLFILFFPHLIAGPIVRARDFLHQIRRPKRWNWLRMEVGVQYFLLGLFKKVAIADHMAPFVDALFANPGAYSTGSTWVAVLAYAIQIYCDFSGYSDMALGTAHLLGYRLAVNFNMPYLAANVSEFWRRWHISLSTWLRDYLFIPLGGSRCSNARTNLNLMITMTLGGLWHGASWNFVIWGVVQGLMLVIHRVFRGWCEGQAGLQRVLQSLPGLALRVGFTFLCICLAWVLFRAPTMQIASGVFTNLFSLRQGAAGFNYRLSVVAVLGGILLLGHVLGWNDRGRRFLNHLPAPVAGIGYALLLTLTLVLTPEEGKPFVYFQF
jgi:alginate O-acetyltransferase complex protein AlgI